MPNQAAKNTAYRATLTSQIKLGSSPAEKVQAFKKYEAR